MTKEQFEEAYLQGFMASGEGWNGEWPFDTKEPEYDPKWVKLREEAFDRFRTRTPADKI